MINALSRAAQIYFQAEFKKYSIGHAQVPTLIFIAKNQRISQLESSKYLKLDKSSVTSQLKILEKNGYISRSRSQSDAGVYLLKITDKTHEILKPMKVIFTSWTETLFDGFTEQKRAEAFVLLERMNQNAKNKLHQLKSPING